MCVFPYLNLVFRDIAPSCVENVDELIERQEKSLVQLETKRGVVKELIEKGKQILVNPDKPKFLEGHVQVKKKLKLNYKKYLLV